MSVTTEPLGIVPVGQISVREGWNPREGLDEAELSALADSVRAQGILQPLLVEETADGLVVVEGHRRLEAARRAGLAEVPVLRMAGADGEPARLAAALAANMRRAELTPIEQARAFERALAAGWTQRRIAQAIGAPRRFVGERLRLLALPEAAIAAIHAGQVPLSAAARLREIAQVSPAVAELIVAAIVAGRVRAGELEQDPAGVLADLEEEAAAAAVVLVPVPGRCPPELVATLPGGSELAEALVELPEWQAMARLGAEDVDAARAYGCLLEWPDPGNRYWRHAFVTDPAFIADRVRLYIERERERAAEHRAAAEALRDGGGAGDAPAPAAADPDERRAQRAAAKAEARAAAIANLDLDRRLGERLDEPEAITREMTTALAELVLADHEGDLGFGMRLVKDALRSVEHRVLKSGATRERIVYAEPAEAREAIREWVLAGRSPEAVLGRLLHALIGAWYCDERAVPVSQQRALGVPHLLRRRVPAAFDALAVPALPERLAALHERRRTRPGAPAGAGEAQGAEPPEDGPGEEPEHQEGEQGA